MSRARRAEMSTDDAAPVRVLFIGGWGRSGSTLVERLLAEMPDVVGAGEVTHLWRRALADNQPCACGAPFDACPFWISVGKAAFDGWDNVDADDVLALARRVDRTALCPPPRAPDAPHAPSRGLAPVRRALPPHLRRHRRGHRRPRDRGLRQARIPGLRVAASSGYRPARAAPRPGRSWRRVLVEQGVLVRLTRRDQVVGLVHASILASHFERVVDRAQRAVRPARRHRSTPAAVAVRAFRRRPGRPSRDRTGVVGVYRRTGRTSSARTEPSPSRNSDRSTRSPAIRCASNPALSGFVSTPPGGPPCPPDGAVSSRY